MAVYKVIQDVEAEDKILGPLSLKQLIYAGVGFGFMFIAFRLVVATGTIFIAIPFLPFIIVALALAAPLSREQSTEIWLAAQIRFYTKPRKRLWDQDGMKELVHITVPKRIEKHYTDGLNQNQVRSRLSALASTLDSRGWAVKNSSLNMSATTGFDNEISDRLIDPSSLPQMVIDNPVTAADDILDVANNRTAHHFDEMMKQSSQAHKQLVIDKMHQTSAAPAPVLPTPAANSDIDQPLQPPNDYFFMHQSQPEQPLADDQTMFSETLVQPGAQTTVAVAADDDDLTDEERQAIEHAKELKKNDELQNYNHHKVVLTPSQLQEQAKQAADQARQQAAAEAEAKQRQNEQKAAGAKTHLKKADTIELANADNLKISTIAGLAKHKTKEEPDEVVINLH